jgi:hypothetical protein
MWGLKSNKCFSGTGVTLGCISHFRPMSEEMFHMLRTFRSDCLIHKFMYADVVGITVLYVDVVGSM